MAPIEIVTPRASQGVGSWPNLLKTSPDDFHFEVRLELEYGQEFGSITTKGKLLAVLQNPEIIINKLAEFAIIIPQ